MKSSRSLASASLGPATLALALMLLAPPALAQGQARPDSTNAPGQDSQAARFRLADRYLSAGRTEQGIALLEDLYDESPSTLAFYQKLTEAYESQKRYDDAIAVVEREMQRRGRAPTLLSEKARLQYRSGGDEEAAFATWDAALAAAPKQPQTYRTVYSSLTDARLFQQAIATIQQGREALGDPAAMRLQLAYLYSLTSQHGEAIGEYLALLEDNPGRLSFVKRRLNRFLDQESALQESIAATRRAVRAEPTRRPYREMMGWLYLQADRHEEALRAYRAIDRLASGNGRLLYSFAQQAADAGAYQAALQAYDLILERHSDAPVAAGALRGRGQVHEQWAEGRPAGPDSTGPDSTGAAPPPRASRAEREAHYEQALEAYRSFLEQYPQHEAYPSVLRAVGRLQQDALFDLEAAQATLEDVARRYPQSQAAHLARYDLGRLYVMRGNLTDARLAFSRLADRLGTGDLAQKARYQQALLHFYEGEFDAAATLLGPLAENTDADVSNDGIGLGVLLSENAMSGDSTGQALSLYARARLTHRQRQNEKALALLDQFLEAHGRHPAADDARFFKAQALADAGRPAEAAEAYAQVALAHPKSTLADRSLFQAAHLQEGALADPEAALQTYQRLLEDYPGSLYAPDVRARIRALRAQTQAGDEPAS